MTEVRIISVEQGLTEYEMKVVQDKLQEAMTEADIDGSFVLINREIEAIDKDELIKELQE